MIMLLSPPFQPFIIAIAILFGLIVIEVVSLFFGASISGILDSLSGIKGLDQLSLFESSLGWLNIGRVPFLVLFMIGLGTFSIFGILIQTSAISLYAPFPAWVAAIMSFGLMLPITRMSSRFLAKVIPQDETYATETDHFIGRIGVVTLGPVKKGAAARIKIQDEWKNWHFPRVCPSLEDEVIAEGEKVLVVDIRGNEMVVTKANIALTT